MSAGEMGAHRAAAGENGAASPMATDIETFAAPWPGVLVEMKDFIDLWFLAASRTHRPAALRVFISKTLVSRARLQPHARAFRTAVSRIPCPIELKGTDEPAHRIEIDYRR